MPLKDRLCSVEESMVKKFYFRFTMYGWATIVIDEAHGDLLINSDWGKWCHTWGGGPKNWGAPTFSEFLKSTNPSYIAEKLGYGIETMTMDVDAVELEMKKHIIKRRREGFDITPTQFSASQKEHTRELWEETLEFTEALRSDEGYARHCLITPAMDKEFPIIEEWLTYKPTTEHKFLSDELLPVFLSYLRGEIRGKPSRANSKTSGDRPN